MTRPLVRPLTLIAALLVVGSLVFAACGDDESDSLSGDVEQLCDDVSALNSTIRDIAGQDIDLKSTSVTEVKNTLAEIQSQIEAITDSTSAVSEQVRSDLSDAYDQLKSDLAAVKDSDSLEEAGQQIETARTNFRDAWEGIVAELKLLGEHDRVADTVGVP